MMQCPQEAVHVFVAMTLKVFGSKILAMLLSV
jgi:hypothetical protein